jgi:hypothetical protein
MIRSQHFSLIRMLLLAFTLGVTLSACASDGRLDVKNLDLAKLKFKQPDWMRWDRDTKPAAASPQPQTAQKTAPDIAAAPDSATKPAAPASVTARPGASYSAYSANVARSTYAPRPKPERPPARLTKSSPLPPPKARLAEIKEQPAKAPQGKVTTAIPEALAVLPPPGKPPRAEGKGGYSTNDLVGLDGPAVERLLGKPDLSRKEPFAEVWQYAHGDCVLFLFIYAEAGGGARVSHAETGARDGGPTPEPGQCIGAILSRNAAVPG